MKSFAKLSYFYGWEGFIIFLRFVKVEKNLSTDEFQILMGHSPEFQTHISNCLPDTSKVSNRHFQLTVLKTGLCLLSFPPLLLAVTPLKFCILQPSIRLPETKTEEPSLAPPRPSLQIQSDLMSYLSFTFPTLTQDTIIMH